MESSAVMARKCYFVLFINVFFFCCPTNWNFYTALYKNYILLLNKIFIWIYRLFPILYLLIFNDNLIDLSGTFNALQFQSVILVVAVYLSLSRCIEIELKILNKCFYCSAEQEYRLRSAFRVRLWLVIIECHRTITVFCQ